MDYTLNNKRRVIHLVMQWAAVHGDHLLEEDGSVAFLEVGLEKLVAYLSSLKSQFWNLDLKDYSDIFQPMPYFSSLICPKVSYNTSFSENNPVWSY